MEIEDSSLLRRRRSFFCAFSEDEHFIVDPVELKCGHQICKKCVFNKHLTSICCNICGCFSLFNENSSKSGDEQIEANLNELFSILKNKFKKSLNDLKDYVDYKSKKVDIDIDYAKDEIEIRIESLKIELDELKTGLYKQLDGYRDEFKDKLDNIQEQNYDEYLEDLHQSSENTTVAFRNHVETLTKLEDDLKALKTSYHIGISVNEKPPKSFIVGQVYLHDGIEGKIGEHMLKKCKFVDGAEILDACVLPNNTIACVIYYKTGIVVVDHNWKTIKEIQRLDSQPNQRISAIETNQRDRIYFYYIDRIVMTDLEFQHLADYSIDSQFVAYKTWFGHMQYYDGHLYALDEITSCVLKLSSDLQLVNKLPIPPFEHYKMSIANNLVMITSGDEIYFCSLDTLTFKYNYQFIGINFACSFVVNDFFYVFDDREWSLYCFNKSGVFIDILELDLKQDLKKAMKDEYRSSRCYYNYNNHTLNFTTGVGKMLIFHLLK